jgi:hypothetical protein
MSELASLIAETRARPWRAILDGALREQALQIVRAIGDALSSWPPEIPGLGNGAAGLAVCFAYLAEGLGEPEHEATARRFLEQAIAMAEELPMFLALYGGLAGVGWAATHLRDRFRWPELEATVAEIDDALLQDLRRTEWREDYGLMSGLVGLGVYALERLTPGADATRLAAVECLERVIDHLAATAEHKPEGATWWRGPERLSLHSRKKVPNGWYDVGLGDGVSGVVALLARACASGVAVDRARPLLDEAVRWVLAQELPDGPPEGFPYGIRPNQPQRNWTRSSWAYGDPGVAIALLGGARCVGEPSWEERARIAALRATTRPPDRTRIFDAGLAIGAAGLGHLFNRLSQVWDEPRLAERSRFWFERALQMRRPGQGIAGFAARVPDEDDVEHWGDDPGIITGAAGIALALLAAATPFEPAWDRMMLVQIPALPFTAPKTPESIMPGRVGPAR